MSSNHFSRWWLWFISEDSGCLLYQPPADLGPVLYRKAHPDLVWTWEEPHCARDHSDFRSSSFFLIDNCKLLRLPKIQGGRFIQTCVLSAGVPGFQGPWAVSAFSLMRARTSLPPETQLICSLKHWEGKTFQCGQLNPLSREACILWCSGVPGSHLPWVSPTLFFFCSLIAVDLVLLFLLAFNFFSLTDLRSELSLPKNRGQIPTSLAAGSAAAVGVSGVQLRPVSVRLLRCSRSRAYLARFGR